MTIYRYMNFAVLGADGKPIQNTNPADNAVAQTYKNIMSEIGGIKNSVSQLANVVSHGMGMGMGSPMFYNGNQNMFQNMMGQFLQGAMGGNTAGGPDQRGHTILGGLAGVLGRGIMNTRNKIYDNIVGGFDRAVNGDKAKTYEYNPEQKSQETQGGTDNPAENNTQNDQQQNNPNNQNQMQQDQQKQANTQQSILDRIQADNDKLKELTDDLNKVNQQSQEAMAKKNQTPLAEQGAIDKQLAKYAERQKEIKDEQQKLQDEISRYEDELSGFSHIRSYSDLMLFCRKCKEEYKNDPRRKR